MELRGRSQGAFAGTAATGAAVKLPGWVYEFDPVNREITAGSLFRRHDITQTDFITPASGAAEYSAIVVRFTYPPKGTDRGVIRLHMS